MTIRVGRWDCPACGFVGNYGPSVKCEKCGAPRPANVKFYLPDNAEIVTDNDQINKAKAGADWICSYCLAQNKVYDKNCKSCGNDREIHDGDKSLEQKVYKLGEEPKDGSKTKIQPVTEKKLLSPKQKKLGCGCLSVIGGIVLILFILAMFTKEVDVKVAEKKWERNFTIEHYKQVVEEDWSLPREGELEKSFEAIHHYDKKFSHYETRTRSVEKRVGSERVKVGTRDLGNGHFEDVYENKPIYRTETETYKESVYDDIPVYRTKYRYRIYRWIPEKVKLEGYGDNPYTKQVENCPNEKCRIKDSSAVFSIVVDFENEKHTEKVERSYWNNIRVNGTVKAKKASVYGNYIGLVKEKK